jgi:hypothetical protein
MNPAPSIAFLDAVVDTICPGLAGDRALPSATGAGLTGRAYAEHHAEVLQAIADSAGGEAAFLAGPPGERVRVLERAEASGFVAFRALVQAVVADYHEMPAVLEAFGWRADPPQPRGRHLEPMDAGLDVLLERVRARGPIWRMPG